MAGTVSVAGGLQAPTAHGSIMESPMVEIEQRQPLVRGQAGAQGHHHVHVQAPGHRLHRAVGLRQVHAAALPQPDERPRRRRADRPGTIRIGGTDIYDPALDVTELRKRVGMVFQKSNPFPKSIYENVVYGLRILGVNDKADLDEASCERSLRGAALWDEVKDRLHESALGLSGGQQQRLCIARAIAVEPEVLLMDEPCSALDPIATAKIEELMLELKDSYTIVIVTHNMQQAARVSRLHGLHAAGRAGRVRRDARSCSPIPARRRPRTTSPAGSGRSAREDAAMQRHFHDELEALKQTLLAMGGLVEDQIRRVMRALIERDDALAQEVIERDQQVNAYDVEMDETLRRASSPSTSPRRAISASSPPP